MENNIRIFQFSNRLEENRKAVKQLEDEYLHFFNETSEAGVKIGALIEVTRGNEHTYTPEYLLKFRNLVREGNDYLTLRGEIIEMEGSLHELFAKFIAAATTLIRTSMLDAADEIELLEKKYTPDAEKHMHDIKEKMKVVRERHEELKKLFAGFET